MFHWPDARSKHCLQFQNVSINSLWTEDVTLSLGEQLQEIRTPSGFAAPQGDESVLRVYMTLNNHQSIITLEYAVLIPISLHP